ncbi:MAG: hypothetical protein K5793_09305 [Nitrosarchaeum sp.]|nr:hypothetical protein [Nitrosarchaeum sp.]MCV0398424.1 hypothetical protein [Nitrosarchaeum sp.]
MTRITLSMIVVVTLIAGFSYQQAYGPLSMPELDDRNYKDTKTKAIPDWVDNIFRWYAQGQIKQTDLLNALTFLLDNGYMHISDEASREVQDLKEINKRLHYGISLSISEGKISEDEFESVAGIDVEPVPVVIGVPNLLDARKGANESSSNDRPTEEVAFYYNKISFATDIVSDVLVKGGTTFAWNEGLLAFSKYGMSDSVANDLQQIVVLCNNAIEKKSQKIEAELEMIEHWLAIIAQKQSSSANSDSTSGRTTADTTQYSQSDLDFIQRKLSSIDQQINSLTTGIKVMDDKLQTVGDDAQLTNIDLQNALQKQQQNLQTMSDISKTLHDTAMNIIRKIG